MEEVHHWISRISFEWYSDNQTTIVTLVVINPVWRMHTGLHSKSVSCAACFERNRPDGGGRSKAWAVCLLPANPRGVEETALVYVAAPVGSRLFEVAARKQTTGRGGLDSAEQRAGDRGLGFEAHLG